MSVCEKWGIKETRDAPHKQDLGQTFRTRRRTAKRKAEEQGKELARLWSAWAVVAGVGAVGFTAGGPGGMFVFMLMIMVVCVVGGRRNPYPRGSWPQTVK